MSHDGIWIEGKTANFYTPISNIMLCVSNEFSLHTDTKGDSFL